MVERKPKHHTLHFLRLMGAGAVLPSTSPPPWLLSSLLANSSSPAAKKVLPAALTDTVAWNRCEEVCHHRPRSPPLRCLFWMPGDIDVDLADCWMKRRQTHHAPAHPSQSLTTTLSSCFQEEPRKRQRQHRCVELLSLCCCCALPNHLTLVCVC